MTRSVVVWLALASVAGCAQGVYAPEAGEDAASAKARDTGWEDPHEERWDAPKSNNGKGDGKVDDLVETTVVVAPNALIVAPLVEWDYLDHGTGTCKAAPSDWNTTTFVPDTNWASGAAELGYGDADEETVIGFGSSSSRKCIAYYFRHEFTVDDPDLFESLVVRLLRDDGAVVYLNGQEVVRSNMPAGTISGTTRALTTADGAAEDTFFEFDVANGLVAGTNVLAVEVHQRSSGSSDVSFNLALEGVLDTTLDTGDPTQSTDSFLGDDATIQESTPDTKFGTRSTCKMDGAAGETNTGLHQSCLMQFDVSTVPDGATVLAAHLQVHVTNTTTDRYPVYPLLQEWVESTVTWNDRNGTADGDWTAAGALDPGTLGTEPADGDRAPAVTVVNGLTTGLLLVPLPPDLVQFWVDDDDLNFGVVFADRDLRNGMDLATGETTSAPTLVVTYEDPQAP